MPEPFRIVEARPLGAPAGAGPDPLSPLTLALFSSPEQSRMEAALTAALLDVFRADRCAILGEEATTEFRAQLAREARSRGEVLSVLGDSAALCAPLQVGAAAPASLILERTAPFTPRELALLAAFAPLAALALRNARLFERASTDGLTGLPHRQRFAAELEEAVALEGPLSLILFDLDHFKDKNDVYGRPVGDRALAELGDAFRPLPIQASARSGEDEFALLIRVDAARALEFAEDLRTTIANRVFDEEHEGIHLTASGGVAERRAGEMASGLFARAAEALSSAKRDGRNRVAVAR
ncbi:MAG TPA: GGDEF domain-containing protein [Planctomycetota bacterium]|nr:GGDEF domain-containing protein [Planctomycetota bacterium]